MGSREDRQEQQAALILERILGGSHSRLDYQNGTSIRDFDLVDDDGATQEAVEVTSVQLGPVRATQSELEKLRSRDLGLSESWSVAVHEAARVKPIVRSAASHLNLLSAAGVGRFDTSYPPGASANAQVVRALGELSIASGYAMPSAKPARLYASGWGSGAIDVSNLTEAVEAQLSDEGNRTKLKAAPDGANRHLFVWLDDSHWYISSLLRDLRQRPPDPWMPAEVDVVWAAAGADCEAILRGDRSRWDLVDVNEDRDQQLQAMVAAMRAFVAWVYD